MRRPRRLNDPTVAADTRAAEATTNHAHVAGVEYITDPHKRSLEHHWESRWRARGIAWSTFAHWSSRDSWVAKRTQFWEQVEQNIFEFRAQEITQQRIEELRELTEIRNAMGEYLQPLRDHNGNIRRHPATDDDYPNLPMYPLKLPPMDRFMKAFLEVDARILERRGHAQQSEREQQLLLEQKREVDTIDVTPDGEFSVGEMRAMARALVRERQPELVQQPEVGILVEGYHAEVRKHDPQEDD